MMEERKFYSLLSSKTGVPLSEVSKQYSLHFPNLKKKMGVGFLIHVFYKTPSQSMC